MNKYAKVRKGKKDPILFTQNLSYVCFELCLILESCTSAITDLGWRLQQQSLVSCFKNKIHLELIALKLAS
jgi:hypothetical protein